VAEEPSGHHLHTSHPPLRGAAVRSRWETSASGPADRRGRCVSWSWSMNGWPRSIATIYTGHTW